MMSDEAYAEAHRELVDRWRERGPLCPADLDPAIWAAVAANYPDADWSPGPEYHTEYRDARVAAQAALSRRDDGER